MTRTWGLRHPRIHRGAAAMIAVALVGDAFAGVNGVGHHAACLRASSEGVVVVVSEAAAAPGSHADCGFGQQYLARQ